MKQIVVIVLTVQLFFLPQARASIFGEETAVLIQILSNALQQLAQLRQIFQNGKDSLDLLKDINQGINDSLALIKTISPNTDPGLYKDWEKVSDALGKLQDIYGTPVESQDSQVQKDTDETVAEAVTLNNSIYKYTKLIDEIGEMIKLQSHAVSPGGAAKLTAQSLGVMLNLQNEILRTQATGLKLQAQNLAIQNRKDKALTRQMVNSADNLKSALTNQNPNFQLPRFE